MTGARSIAAFYRSQFAFPMPKPSSTKLLLSPLPLLYQEYLNPSGTLVGYWEVNLRKRSLSTDSHPEPTPEAFAKVSFDACFESSRICAF